MARRRKPIQGEHIDTSAKGLVASTIGLPELPTGPLASLRKPSGQSTQVNTHFQLAPRTLDELLRIPPDQLHHVDTARMNLLCASAMPTTQGLDIEHALATLDRWTRRVAFETDRHLYRVTDQRYASHYQHSESHFRAEMLGQVLIEDLGIKYNKNAIGNFSFADPTVAFIHGMIPAPGKTTDDTTGGTCASMPVLYVAIGRRLGYPLSLVAARNHLFARWDGEALFNAKPIGHTNPAWRETFNIETTNGFYRHDDDHYRHWPKAINQDETEYFRLLRSYSRARELAGYLANRAAHAIDLGQFRFAAMSLENAYLYDPAADRRAYFFDTALKTDYEPQTPELKKQLIEIKLQKLEKQYQPPAASFFGKVPTCGLTSMFQPPQASTHPLAHCRPATPNNPYQDPLGPSSHRM